MALTGNVKDVALNACNAQAAALLALPVYQDSHSTVLLAHVPLLQLTPAPMVKPPTMEYVRTSVLLGSSSIKVFAILVAASQVLLPITSEDVWSKPTPPRPLTVHLVSSFHKMAARLTVPLALILILSLVDALPAVLTASTVSVEAYV